MKKLKFIIKYNIKKKKKMKIKKKLRFIIKCKAKYLMDILNNKLNGGEI